MSRNDTGASGERSAPAPVLYITDLTFAAYDPADLFDLAYLVRSPEQDLRGVCLASGEASDGAARVLDALSERALPADSGGVTLPYYRGADGLAEALDAAPEPVSVVVVGGYSAVAEVLERRRDLFRAKVARLFLVGGYANDYGAAGAERLPIDPRLRQRNPERFAPAGDPRVTSDPAHCAAWAALLTSGEGVIWLPRDICQWRYAAPGMLEDGGPLCAFLLQELFSACLRDRGVAADRYEAADAPVLLSALPALLLAARPDPFLWMRLFRAITARVAVTDAGILTAFDPKSDTPNLYAVVGIDGQALGKLLTARLRDRPLPTVPPVAR